MWKDIKINWKKFIKNKNTRKFDIMMEGLSLAEGEGRLGMVASQAGRGKSRTAQWYANENNCVYLEMLKVWAHSPLDFLRALCNALGIVTPPRRKGPCFMAIVEELKAVPRPVFLDEFERLPQQFLDLVKDLTDLTAVPFVLIGEEELTSYMQQNRRIWSRTYYQVDFDPISPPDIIFYIAELTGLKITGEIANIFYNTSDGKSSAGNFRVVRRAVIALVQICNIEQTQEVTVDIAKMAINKGLSGKQTIRL